MTAAVPVARPTPFPVRPNPELVSSIRAVAQARAGGNVDALLLAAVAAARQIAGTAWCVLLPVGPGALKPVMVGPAGTSGGPRPDAAVLAEIYRSSQDSELGYPVRSGTVVFARIWCGPHARACYGDSPIFQAVIDEIAAVFHGRDRSAPELSGRETEILRNLAAGLSNEQIADRLFISTGTVKFHVRNIIHKLHARNRAQAVYLGARKHII